MKNLIVGQSGGPTAAINSSLAGVIKAGADFEQIGKVYGMINGIAGMMERQIIDLDKLSCDSEKLELLQKSPASYLGSCRYKMPNDDKGVYEKIFKILEEYEIGYFFYIGGNDSMDTVAKLSKYAAAHGKDIKFVGVSKTVDNDLPEMDHTPGFGSAAKYVAATVREVAADSGVYATKSVEIVEVMGRDAGWLAGSSVLASLGGLGPDLIYLPEREFDLDRFYSDISEKLKIKNHVLIVISEGIKGTDGKYICESLSSMHQDAFGHTQLGGTAKIIEILVKQRFGIKVRGIELNTPQRCASHILSKTDIEEAFKVGYTAVESAILGKTGVVIAIKRISDNPYKVFYEAVDVDKVANVAKTVPDDYINDRGNFVTEKFINYIKPLVEGEIYPEYENGVPKFLVLGLE